MVGYKAGLTNPAVQKRFNTDKPVWGKLYEGMVLANGAAVDAAFGAPTVRGRDMLVRVKSAQINQAKTPLRVQSRLTRSFRSSSCPTCWCRRRPNSTALASAPSMWRSSGRCRCAAGHASLPCKRYAFLQALADMQVSLTDGAGTRLGGGKGSDILDAPLNAVVWLAKPGAEGLAMQPGDLISLGSFSPLLPPKAGLSVTATIRRPARPSLCG